MKKLADEIIEHAHLVASLVCHFLALRHRVRLANTPRHFVATFQN